MEVMTITLVALYLAGAFIVLQQAVKIEDSTRRHGRVASMTASVITSLMWPLVLIIALLAWIFTGKQSEGE